jgi:threonine-phosphate decarboxylase
VTTLAASAAAEAVKDSAYAQRTVASVTEQRRWLRQALETIGATVYPSAANFLLLQLPATAPTSTEVREHLITRRGVVVRDCRSFHGLSTGRFIRVAVRRQEENEQLVRALDAVVKVE